MSDSLATTLARLMWQTCDALTKEEAIVEMAKTITSLEELAEARGRAEMAAMAVEMVRGKQ